VLLSDLALSGMDIKTRIVNDYDNDFRDVLIYVIRYLFSFLMISKTFEDIEDLFSTCRAMVPQKGQDTSLLVVRGVLYLILYYEVFSL
jgi:hypothetical protein